MPTELERLEADLEDSFKTTFEGNLWGVLERYTQLKAEEIADLAVFNAVGAKVKSVSVDYVANISDQLIKVTVVEKTVTLPPLSEAYSTVTRKGIVITFMKDSAEVGEVYLEGDGIEEITDPTNGSETQKSLGNRYETIQVVATSTVWHMI